MNVSIRSFGSVSASGAVLGRNAKNAQEEDEGTEESHSSIGFKRFR